MLDCGQVGEAAQQSEGTLPLTGYVPWPCSATYAMGRPSGVRWMSGAATQQPSWLRCAWK